MTGEIGVPAVHPAGEQPIVELAADEPVAADTFAGRVHLEWEPAAPVTTMGQLAFFIPSSGALIASARSAVMCA